MVAAGMNSREESFLEHVDEKVFEASAEHPQLRKVHGDQFILGRTFKKWSGVWVEMERNKRIDCNSREVFQNAR